MEAMADKRVAGLLRRHHILPQDIKYMVHSDQRTVLYLLDGRQITSTLPLKVIYGSLSDREFWSIQKGIVVSVRNTVSIDDSGVYTMVDGKTFKGRSRNPAEHKRRRDMLNLPMSKNRYADSKLPQKLLQQCVLLENATMAFCVIELIFSENGHSFDFVFRYCNKEMENLEGMSVENILGHSFYEVFPRGDQKWIVPYADVAVNGTSKCIHDYSPEIQRDLTIHCFQPMPGYCACLLSPTDET